MGINIYLCVLNKHQYQTMNTDTSNHQQNGNEDKNTLKDFEYHNMNPYVPAVVEHISEKTYRKASGLKWEQVLNENTGELERKTHLVLGEQKKVDSQEFYKVYNGAIKSFYNLSNKSMDLFDYIMTHIKYGNDRICISSDAIKENKGMSKSTCYRCLIQLLNAQIIAKASTEGCYYINPAIAFKGDRITLVKQYINSDKQERSSFVSEDGPEYANINKDELKEQ